MNALTFQDIVSRFSYFNTYDIQVNISYIFDIPQSQVAFKTYSEKEFEIIDTVFNKLKKGMPLQYALNKAYFYGRSFYVDENVLIPRFDTEILVNQAIQDIKKNNFNSCLDMCCGSGAIGITIKLETNVDVTCSDISKNALNITQKNAEMLNANIKTFQSDLFDNVKNKFDIIVSNPPYIKTADIQNLDSIVKDFEPRLALDGKQDGLYFYQEIIENAHKFLNQNGILCFEVGIGQAKDVAEMLKNNYKNVRIINDYNNIERVVIGELC